MDDTSNQHNKKQEFTNEFNKQIEADKQYYEEFCQRILIDLLPIDKSYVATNLDAVVAWLYSKLTENNLLAIKSLKKYELRFLDDYLRSYLFAQFRPQENTELKRDAAKYDGKDWVMLEDVPYILIFALWKRLQTKKPKL